MLIGVWWFSLALALSSTAMMVALVIRRIVITAHERRTAAIREASSIALIAYLDGDGSIAQVKTAIAGRYRLLARVVDEIGHLLRGDNRERLVQVLGELGYPERDTETVRKGRPHERAAAAARLGIFDDPRALKTLRAALDDPAVEVRLAAALALARRSALGPVRRLLRQLARGGAPLEIAQILRQVGTTDPASLLEIVGSPEIPVRIRAQALEAVSRSGDYGLIEHLAPYAAAPSTELRIAAVRALGEFGHPAGAESILAALDDPEWPVRTQAAIAAGRAGLVEAIPMLVRRLDDESWWTRYRAADALYSLGNAGRSALVAAAADDGRRGRIAAGLLAEKAAGP